MDAQEVQRGEDWEVKKEGGEDENRSTNSEVCNWAGRANARKPSLTLTFPLSTPSLSPSLSRTSAQKLNTGQLFL